LSPTGPVRLSTILSPRCFIVTGGQPDSRVRLSQGQRWGQAQGQADRWLRLSPPAGRLSPCASPPPPSAQFVDVQAMALAGFQAPPALGGPAGPQQRQPPQYRERRCRPDCCRSRVDAVRAPRLRDAAGHGRVPQQRSAQGVWGLSALASSPSGSSSGAAKEPSAPLTNHSDSGTERTAESAHEAARWSGPRRWQCQPSGALKADLNHSTSLQPVAAPGPKRDSPCAAALEATSLAPPSLPAWA